MKKFVEEFPNAIDIIIRGVKAGLPLGDCLRVIANESAEPVRSEFRQIVETQAMGFSTSEAVDRIGERVPIPEARFFAIVISIQQKAGGNLAEALGNLSGVLRDRKKMKGKIKAMSSEAKASAYLYYRKLALHRCWHGLGHKPEIYGASMDNTDRTTRHGGLRGVDGNWNICHEKHD
jgi:tight adherence protein B